MPNAFVARSLRQVIKEKNKNQAAPLWYKVEQW